MNSSICRKTQKQKFLLISGSHICAPQRDTNMVSPYKLNEFKWNIFLNILGMKYCADPILGKAFCTFTFFHFPDFRLSVLNCVHFYFWWHDSENREYGHFTVADPDLQIRGRPGHPDPKIRGGSGNKKDFFWPLGPQFGLKIRGMGRSPGSSPGSATASLLQTVCFVPGERKPFDVL